VFAVGEVLINTNAGYDERALDLVLAVGCCRNRSSALSKGKTGTAPDGIPGGFLPGFSKVALR